MSRKIECTGNNLYWELFAYPSGQHCSSPNRWFHVNQRIVRDTQGRWRGDWTSVPAMWRAWATSRLCIAGVLDIIEYRTYPEKWICLQLKQKIGLREICRKPKDVILREQHQRRTGTMELHGQTQSSARMVKWRDIDASTISRWIEQSRIQEEGHADAFPASSQKSKMDQVIGKTTFDRDLEYTFNSA